MEDLAMKPFPREVCAIPDQDRLKMLGTCMYIKLDNKIWWWRNWRVAPKISPNSNCR